ncbi:hypothetical protein ACS0TY_022467 [Phlomoides rotata]
MPFEARPEWVLHHRDFCSLNYLLLEDTDLVHWRADDYSHFLSLWFLTIRHCFKLKEIPWRSFSRVCTTELVDCHPSASEQMPEDYVARVYFSWEGA